MSRHRRVPPVGQRLLGGHGCPGGLGITGNFRADLPARHFSGRQARDSREFAFRAYLVDRTRPIVCSGRSVVECKNWNAWSKRNPALPSILYVHAQCECPTGGYQVELRRAAEQESDSVVLVLDLVGKPPCNPDPQATELIELEYWETTSTEYDEVHIQPGNVVVKIYQTT